MLYTIQNENEPFHHTPTFRGRLLAMYALVNARMELPPGADNYALYIADDLGRPIDTHGLSLRQWARGTDEED